MVLRVPPRGRGQARAGCMLLRAGQDVGNDRDCGGPRSTGRLQHDFPNLIDDYAPHRTDAGSVCQSPAERLRIRVRGALG